MTGEPEAAALTRSLLQVDEFVSTDMAVLAGASANQLGIDIAQELQKIHLPTLRLIAAERLAARREAQVFHQDITATERHARTLAWNDAWTSNERLQEIREKQPLAVHRLGRNAMLLINSMRFDEDGELMDTLLARSTTQVPLTELAQQHDADPVRTGRHLRSAGFIHRFRPDEKAPEGVQIAADSAAYLKVYPPLLPMQDGEKNINLLSRDLNTSYQLIRRIINQHHMRPIARTLTHRVRFNEIECYGKDHVATIRQEVDKMPVIDPESETSLWDFLSDLPSGAQARKLRTCIPIEHLPYRRWGGTKIGGGPIVTKELQQLLQIAYEHMFTGQPLDTADLARKSGQPEENIDPVIAAAIRNATTIVHKSSRPSVVEARQAVLERARVQTLPPSLISAKAIGKRLHNWSYSTVIRHLSALDEDPPFIMLIEHKTRSRNKCHSWDIMRRLEQKCPPPEDAVHIDWGRLPKDANDLDPDRIAYAYELQLLYVSDPRQAGLAPPGARTVHQSEPILEPAQVKQAAPNTLALISLNAYSTAMGYDRREVLAFAERHGLQLTRISQTNKYAPSIFISAEIGPQLNEAIDNREIATEGWVAARKVTQILGASPTYVRSMAIGKKLTSNDYRKMSPNTTTLAEAMHLSPAATTSIVIPFLRRHINKPDPAVSIQQLSLATATDENILRETLADMNIVADSKDVLTGEAARQAIAALCPVLLQSPPPRPAMGPRSAGRQGARDPSAKKVPAPRKKTEKAAGAFTLRASEPVRPVRPDSDEVLVPTINNIMTIMRTDLPSVSREVAPIYYQKTGANLRSLQNNVKSLKVDPKDAAEVSRALALERLRRLPSTRFSREQIALMAGKDSATVTKAIRKEELRFDRDPEEAVYSHEDVARIMANLSIRFA